jgi:hypothetical protein
MIEIADPTKTILNLFAVYIIYNKEVIMPNLNRRGPKAKVP